MKKTDEFQTVKILFISFDFVHVRLADSGNFIESILSLQPNSGFVLDFSGYLR